MGKNPDPGSGKNIPDPQHCCEGQSSSLSNFGMGAMIKANHIDTITPGKSYVGVPLRGVADPDP